VYYKIVKPIRGARFTDDSGRECDCIGFVGKVTMKFGPVGFFSLKQKNGLEVDAREDVIEEVAEFDYETASQFELIKEVDNERNDI